MSPFWMKPLVEEVTGQPAGDPCFDTDAAINSVSIAHETAPHCLSNQEWEVAIDITMTTALDVDKEFKIYVAEDSAGTDFQFWKRSRDVNHVYSVGGQLFGTDGPGASHTKHAKAKVEVVPIDRDDVCHGPVESSQLTRTENLCTT